jgi:hypothetical protein
MMFRMKKETTGVRLSATSARRGYISWVSALISARRSEDSKRTQVVGEEVPSERPYHVVGGWRREAWAHNWRNMGFDVTEDQVHVHDLHATTLRPLGFDHTNSPTCFRAGTSVLRMCTERVVQPCWPEEPMAEAAA